MTGPLDAVTTDNVWDLEADPGALSAAAVGWRGFGRKAGAARDQVSDAAAALRGDAWSGDASDTYHDHLVKLGKSVTEVVEAATAFADALDAGAAALTHAQSALDGALSRVRSAVPTVVSGRTVTFSPRDAKDIPPINAAVAEAAEIRGDLDGELVRQNGRMDAAKQELDSLSWVWNTVAQGRDDGWKLPAEASGTNWIYDGNSVVLNTGPGDDKVSVRVDPRTGEQIVTVNGVETTFPPNYAITVRAGEGNDTVDVAPGTRVGLTLLGGKGDDTLRGGDGADRILGLDGRDTVEGRGGDDRITLGASRDRRGDEDPNQAVTESADGGEGVNRVYGGLGNDSLRGGSGSDLIEGGEGWDSVDGGAGGDTLRGGAGSDNLLGRDGNDVLDGGADRDYLEGGTGDDRLAGGLGDDTLYGMDGNDQLDGGDGQDYLEGAQGNDSLTGGTGNDMLSGGRGDDVISGNGGDDVVYTGHGRDTVDTGAGRDTVYGQKDDTVAGAEKVVTIDISDQAKYVKIEGSPDFVARVEADMDMLRASPTGQQMLGNLQKAHEDSSALLYDGNGLTIRETTDENGYAREKSHWYSWPRESYEIEYNPSFDTLHSGPPVVVLYHEMAHVYDYTNDTLADGTYDQGGSTVPNKERVAAGLPIDHDDDAGTPERIDPDHPYAYTENGLREELGAPHRPRY